MRKNSLAPSPSDQNKEQNPNIQIIREENDDPIDNQQPLVDKNYLSIPEVPKSRRPSTQTELKKETEDPVTSAFRDLDSIVSNLNSNIVGIVKKQNKGIIENYKREMIHQKKGLQELHNKYEESLAKINKDERISELEKENQQLRKEAIIANKSLMEKESEIKMMKMQISHLRDENALFAEYVKHQMKKAVVSKGEHEPHAPLVPKPAKIRSQSSKGRERSSKEQMNKTFITSAYNSNAKGDLSKSLAVYAVEEADIDPNPPRTKLEELERFMDSLQEKNFHNKLVFIRETEKFCKELVSYYEKKLEEIERKFSKERSKLETRTSWKLAENREVFEIFTQCIEDVRKNITQRKMSSKSTIRRPFSRMKQSMEMKEEIIPGNEELLFADKQRVLELFVSHPQVLEVMKYILFPSIVRTDAASILRNSIQKHPNVFEMDGRTSPFSLAEKGKEKEEENRLQRDSKAFRPYSCTKSRRYEVSDSTRIKKTIETDTETLKSDGPKAGPGIINIKFAQLMDPKAFHGFQPKDRVKMKNVINSYKIK